MGKKVILMLFCASVLISGCKRGSFSISGTIDGAGDGEYLLLKEVKPGILEPVDSVVPGKDGRFSFRSETGWPAFFMLSMDDDDFLTMLIAPGEKIEVKAARNSMARPSSVTGSEGTSVILGFRKDQDEVVAGLKKLTDTYNDSIDSPRRPLLMDSLDRRAADIVAGFRARALTLLNENRSSMIPVYLLNQHVVPGLELFEPAKNPELFYSVDSTLYALYPESDLVLDLHSFVAGLRKSVSVGRQAGEPPVPGELLPDIVLPDPDGDTLSLSSLRGRVVLVDFWAAWCPPCREENPNLVRLYDMYHWKGFDIFQVSLDLRKEDWLEAIRNDRLGRWKHVSDLRYRDSEVVKQFGLTEIPASFLIDREGRVTAVNLRGDDLQKKLEELLEAQ
ncbi:MAG TPA: TlpA disulfide reductase family protein [Bacteroidales bacterium]|jgi:peroxiredoxin|nr:TlpA disulfide reductase family protein [Bacteroidales bacterium]